MVGAVFCTTRGLAETLVLDAREQGPEHSCGSTGRLADAPQDLAEGIPLLLGFRLLDLWRLRCGATNLLKQGGVRGNLLTVYVDDGVRSLVIATEPDAFVMREDPARQLLFDPDNADRRPPPAQECRHVDPDGAGRHVRCGIACIVEWAAVDHGLAGPVVSAARMAAVMGAKVSCHVSSSKRCRSCAVSIGGGADMASLTAAQKSRPGPAIMT